MPSKTSPQAAIVCLYTSPRRSAILYETINDDNRLLGLKKDEASGVTRFYSTRIRTYSEISGPTSPRILGLIPVLPP